MRYWLALLLFALGCGKTNLPGETGDGIGRTFNPVVIAADPLLLSKVTNICQALKDKEYIFRTNYLANGSLFNFQVNQTNCSGSTASSAVQTRLALNAGFLQYERVSGDYFRSQLETGLVGTLSPLCQMGSRLTAPLMVGSSLALNYLVSDCTANTNVRCLSLETAMKQVDGRFLVTKVDQFEIDLAAGALSGMVLRHKQQDSSACEAGKKLVNIATFVGRTN